MTHNYKEAEQKWLEERSLQDAHIAIESAAVSDGVLVSNATMVIGWFAMQVINIVAFDKLQMSFDDIVFREKVLQIIEIPLAIGIGRWLGTLEYEERSK